MSAPEPATGPQLPLRWRIGGLLLLLGLPLCLILGYVLAIATLNEDMRLARDSRKIQEELQKAHGEIIRLQKAVQMEKQINAETGKDLRQNKIERLALEQELNLYRSIVEPGRRQGGLQVDSVEVLDGDEAGDYTLQLLVIQLEGQRSWRKGRVGLDIIGEQDDGEVRYSLKELGGPADLPFSLRFFQSLTADIRLPDGVVPTEIVTRIQVQGDKQNESLEKRFPWPSREQATDDRTSEESSDPPCGESDCQPDQGDGQH